MKAYSPLLPPAQPLLEASEPVFAAILAFRAADGTDQTLLYNNLAAQLQQMQERARAAQIDPATGELATLALAALIDELLMTSEWRYRTKWPLLQYRRFKMHRAGERFFENLAAIRGPTCDPAIWHEGAKASLLEIYYCCLLLGFNGQWGVAGATKRQQDMEQILAHIRTRPSSILSPNLSPLTRHERLPARSGWRWWVWLGSGLFLVMLLLLYLIAPMGVPQ